MAMSRRCLAGISIRFAPLIAPPLAPSFAMCADSCASNVAGAVARTGAGGAAFFLSRFGIRHLTLDSVRVPDIAPDVPCGACQPAPRAIMPADLTDDVDTAAGSRFAAL